jgi:hypothetical protein
LLPKLIQERHISSLADYKSYVHEHKQKSPYYSQQVDRIVHMRFPDPSESNFSTKKASSRGNPGQSSLIRKMSLSTVKQEPQSLNMYGGSNMPCFRLLMVKSSTMLHRIGYCDIVEQLLKILVIVTAKVDTLVHSDAMVQKYRECDELLQ